MNPCPTQPSPITPSRRFPATAGLRLNCSDLLGNVCEWCADWYDEKYYASSPAADPPGASRASFRVIRGGCCDYNAWHCRPAYRNRRSSEYGDCFLGFRVAAVQG